MSKRAAAKKKSSNGKNKAISDPKPGPSTSKETIDSNPKPKPSSESNKTISYPQPGPSTSRAKIVLNLEHRPSSLRKKIASAPWNLPSTSKNTGQSNKMLLPTTIASIQEEKTSSGHIYPDVVVINQSSHQRSDSESSTPHEVKVINFAEHDDTKPSEPEIFNPVALRTRSRRFVPMESDEERSGSSGSRPLNNNSSVYFSNSDFGEVCIICFCVQFSRNGITDHYQTMHPDAEVYTSRITKDEALKLRRNLHEFVRVDNELFGWCYFCLVQMKFETLEQWMFHLLEHTGEYLYYCTNCKGSRPNRQPHDDCTKDKIESVYDSIHENDLVGYICNKCNYIQFNEARMISHSVDEHKPSDVYIYSPNKKTGKKRAKNNKKRGKKEKIEFFSKVVLARDPKNREEIDEN